MHMLAGQIAASSNGVTLDFSYSWEFSAETGRNSGFRTIAILRELA